MVYYYTVLNVLVVLFYFTVDLLWSFGSLHIQAAAKNLTCTACPRGSMGNISSSKCKDCPNKGWCQSVAACLKCSPGFFQNSTGQTACLPCPVGHYQEVSGQSNCKICKPGSHQDSHGKSTCIKCDKGFFSGGPGSQKCISCGQGSYCSKHGCTECSPCPTGMEATNMGSVECTPCLKGHYKEERSYDICQRCQEGWYQDKKGQGFCKQCPKEYYCPWPDVAPVPCDPSQLCPAGSTAPGTCKGLSVRHHGTEQCELSSTVYVVIGVVITGVVEVVGIVLCQRYRRHNERERRLLERQHPVYTGW